MIFKNTRHRDNLKIRDTKLKTQDKHLKIQAIIESIEYQQPCNNFKFKNCRHQLKL